MQYNKIWLQVTFTQYQQLFNYELPSATVGWLVGRLTFTFSTRIGYIGDKFSGGDIVPPG